MYIENYDTGIFVASCVLETYHSGVLILFKTAICHEAFYTPAVPFFSVLKFKTNITWSK